MAGEKDRHRFVADLLIRHHRSIIFILGGQQHRQQIAVIAAAGPPIGDEAVDDRVEPRARDAGAAHFRDRQALEHARERQQHQPEALDDAGERFADRGGLRFDVGVEERLADDRQGEPVHLARDVERGAVDPRPPHAVGVLDHHASVAGDALAMKRRLHQPALPEMNRALAGQQAVAEQPLAALEAAALGEVPVVGDEDVFHLLRVADEEQLLAAHAVVDDVAVLARDAREEVERIPAARTIRERREQRKLRPGRSRNGNRHRSSVARRQTEPSAQRAGSYRCRVLGGLFKVLWVVAPTCSASMLQRAACRCRVRLSVLEREGFSRATMQCAASHRANRAQNASAARGRADDRSRAARDCDRRCSRTA